MLFFPLREGVLSHGGEKKVRVHGKNGGAGSRRDLVAAEVEKSAVEGKGHLKGTVVVCFEHAAYSLLDEETFESVSVLGRREVDAEACGGGL